MRGKRIPVTRFEAVARARGVAALRSSIYKLGAGGKDPRAVYPFTVVDGILGSDCIGFVLWCLGIDRFQPGIFPLYGGWLNTDSVLKDATSKNPVFFEFTDKPAPGDLVVYPSISKNGKRVRLGHVAIICDVNTDVSNWTAHLWARGTRDRANFLRKIEVVDCAGSFLRRLVGRAVQNTDASKSWNKADSRFVRYRGIQSDNLTALLARRSEAA